MYIQCLFIGMALAANSVGFAQDRGPKGQAGKPGSALEKEKFLAPEEIDIYFDGSKYYVLRKDQILTSFSQNIVSFHQQDRGSSPDSIPLTPEFSVKRQVIEDRIKKGLGKVYRNIFLLQSRTAIHFFDSKANRLITSIPRTDKVGMAVRKVRAIAPSHTSTIPGTKTKAEVHYILRFPDSDESVESIRFINDDPPFLEAGSAQ